jgi:hypothetical protein
MDRETEAHVQNAGSQVPDAAQTGRQSGDATTEAGNADQVPKFEPGCVMFTLGELWQMWFPPPSMGRRWIKRSLGGALYWVLPDVDGGIVVTAIKPQDGAANTAA